MLKNQEIITNTFDWYLRNVLPNVLRSATQQPYGYHGIYTHTSAVVFRGIDYAIALGKNPKPVVLACAFHDMARKDDAPDIEHGKNAIPLIKTILRDSIPVPDMYAKSIIYAVENHTIGTTAPDYVSACLWDADRTRLSWECGYEPKFFATDRAKQVASGIAAEYLKFMEQTLSQRAHKIIGELDKQY